jgi:coiled-coil domain-containing protein 12
MSTSNVLLAASQDRKARLAQLRSLKRKDPEPDSSVEPLAPTEEESNNPAHKYLSGRNFDITSRTVKLGFENDPTAQTSTLEQQAEEIAERIKEEATVIDGQADEPLDLFKLQPKKPNWDLKRDLATRMAILDVRTENAIARLVRERIEGQKKSDGTGLEGIDLLEAVHVREKEEEEEKRREEEWEKGLVDG